MNVDLDLVGVLQTGQFISVHAGVRDAGFAERVLKPLHNSVGCRHESVLQLNLKYQVTPAPQVETEMDVLVPVGDQFILGFRKADDAVQANQHDGDDESRFELKIAFHESKRWKGAAAPDRGPFLLLLLLRRESGNRS